MAQTTLNAQYDATLPDLQTGEMTPLQTDPQRNLNTTIKTKVSTPSDAPVMSFPALARYHYQAAAGANIVVSATPAYLVGIIIGADVASSVIEVSDSATDGDGAVKVYMASSTLSTLTGGYLPVGLSFATGIAVDQTNQTHCTYVFIPTT